MKGVVAGGAPSYTGGVWRTGGGPNMRTFNVIVERDPDTGFLVGSVPGWPGAHSQGTTLDELSENLREVIAMLLEDGEPKLESEFVGLQMIRVA
jgi:predicted RNase H-like HicB family nuclease